MSVCAAREFAPSEFTRRNWRLVEAVKLRCSSDTTQVAATQLAGNDAAQVESVSLSGFHSQVSQTLRSATAAAAADNLLPSRAAHAENIHPPERPRDWTAERERAMHNFACLQFACFPTTTTKQRLAGGQIGKTAATGCSKPTAAAFIFNL